MLLKWGIGSHHLSVAKLVPEKGWQAAGWVPGVLSDLRVENEEVNSPVGSA